MRLTAIAQDLYHAISEFEIVDAHEHLPSEVEYLAAGYSGLNMFAGGYVWHDLESAGLAAGFKATMRSNGNRTVDEWWPVIRPHWEAARNTSFARALLITARDLFGLPDINDSTIHELAEIVKKDNQPGLYRRILQERCRIRYAITCVDQASFPDDPVFRGITMLLKSDDPGPASSWNWELTGSSILRELSRRAGRRITDLEDAANIAQSLSRAEVAAGAVGFKMYVGEYGAPQVELAHREMRAIGSDSALEDAYPALRDYLFDKCLDVAAEAHIPVAVHTGYWGDFRRVDPRLMFSFAVRRSDVRFDLFHLGAPMIRDALMMGKLLPNVTLNLCWAPIISQTQTIRALDELIDLVPVNKIIAFGGDYRAAVHKVYGHLVMAREAVSAALAARVVAGEMDMEYALHLARLWFYENPMRIYGLDRS